MTSRRNFIKTGGMAVAGLSILGKRTIKSASSISLVTDDTRYISRRPAPDKRKFVSEAVEEEIKIILVFFEAISTN